jgi:hypothetical protein
VTEAQTPCLSTDEIKAVKFAVRRQLRRWRDHDLAPERRLRREHLAGALGVLEQFPGGCELREQEASGERQPAAEV